MIDLISEAQQYDAAPVPGNYTSDPDNHLAQALALSTILIGAGFATFETYNDTIRQDVLSLLSDEIKRARQALRAEQNARQVQR